MAGEGEAADVLRRTTAGYADHPNFADVLLLGLGCEQNQASNIVSLTTRENVRSTTIQAEGGTRAAIARGIAEVEAMLPAANAITRTPRPLSELIVGLQCGGSDAWSGVTANPALGLAMDMLIAAGGSAILSETSEIFGAEHLLTARTTPEIAKQLMARVQWWQQYTARHGQVLDNNPSPGNKAGGLTTILEKSLGAVAKAGSTPLREVIEYAQPITQHGLIFMDSPGYDPVSATGQIASGANLLCFTTGRGSVFGAKPVPSIKLATTSGLFRRMNEDMDINCGTILDGTETLPEVATRIFETVIATASGKLTHSEELGFGEEEFQPWIMSAVL
jgi:altronate hydrolase